MRIRLGALALVASAALPAGASAAEYEVGASNFQFSPSTVSIAPGDTVNWRNDGGFHNVRFDDGSYEQPSDPIATPWRVSRTFSAPGRFTYFCRQHPESMKGVVNVSGDTSPAPGNQPSALPPPIVDSLRTRARRGRRIRVAINPSFGSLAEVTIQRRVRGRWRTVLKIKRKVGSRTKRLTIGRDRRGRPLKPGRYRVSVQLQDDAGQNKGVKGPVERDTLRLR